MESCVWGVWETELGSGERELWISGRHTGSLSKGLLRDSSNSNRSDCSPRDWTLQALYWTECSTRTLSFTPHKCYYFGFTDVQAEVWRAL